VPWMPELAEHIATFDPPTVLALLDVAELCIRNHDHRGFAPCAACAALDRLREVSS
jgi:hypothetical protein